MRAYMVSDRTSKAGFKQDENKINLAELATQLTQLKSALHEPDKKIVDQQCGDFLYGFGKHMGSSRS